MSYDSKILRRATVRFEADRRKRQEEFARRQAAVYGKVPRQEEIDRELRATMSRIISSALRRGADPRPAVAALRQENLDLQRERTALLAGQGLPADYLEERPACPLCSDAGYRGEAVCSCLKAYYAKEQQLQLSQLLDLTGQSFGAFSLDWYDEAEDPVYGISPRENMRVVLDVCTRYAREFSPQSGSLLLYGAPGLGKTFLSAAIAGQVAQRGYSVVYDTAGHIFSRFEDKKFGREEAAAGEDVERVNTCDLLILDDLGTEMNTAFVQSALYEIVNTRLLTHRATILNTNFSPDELARRYSGQVASRIQGEYQVLPFFGKDIRLLKKGR